MTSHCGINEAAARSMLTCVLQLCYKQGMTKTMSLRDANQKFAQLVREVEERREEITITRRGEPVVKIVPAQTGKRKLTSQQQRALDEMFAHVHRHKPSSRGWKFNRDEIYDEALGIGAGKAPASRPRKTRT